MKRIEPSPPLFATMRDVDLSVITNEVVTHLLTKINEEYYYWDKIKFQPIPEGLTHNDVWTIVKLRRRNTPYQLSFGNYSFHWNLNSKLHEYLHFLDMNVGGTLESGSLVSREDKQRYLLSSIMEEAIASSQIEGAVTTRKHAKEMLRKNIRPRNHSEQMIHNNYVTIQRILEIKSEPLTLERFLSIHKLVTTNTLHTREEEGFLRDSNDINVISTVDGTVVHSPPQMSELPFLLDDLFKFFNEDDPKLFIHPIVKACIIHFMVGFIHPFTDGNGRTARALFYYYLLKKEYWLTEYLSISRLILRSKAAYARSFVYCETDENDLTYFLLYKIRTMKLAFEELRSYIKRKSQEKREVRDMLAVDGLTYRQAMILDWYRADKKILLTTSETEKKLGVSYMTARAALNELVDKGYLQIKNINKVLKGYIIGEKFDILISKER